MLVFASEIVPSTRIQLLVGQTFDNETYYVYSALNLGDIYTQLCSDLSSKENLVDFIEQIQEVTNIISFGLKPLGLSFPSKQQFANLNVLKKITQSFNSQVLFIGDRTSFERFDVKSLKNSPVKIKTDTQCKSFLVQLNLDVRLILQEHVPLKDYQKQTLGLLKERIMGHKLIVKGEVVLNESQSLELAPNESRFHAQLLEPQTGSEGLVGRCICGQVPIVVYANQYTTVAQLKQLLFSDLEDQLNLRIQIEDEELTILQRIELKLKENPLIYQSFRIYERQMKEYLSLFDDLLKNFDGYSIASLGVSDETPAPPKPKSKDIDLPELPTIAVPKPIAQPKKLSELYIMGVIVLILGIGMGLRFM